MSKAMTIDELDKVIQEKDIIYNNYKDLEKAYNDLISENMKLEKENKQIEKKLEIAVNAIKTVIREDADNIDGGMLMFLTEALAKIKEIKLCLKSMD